MADPASYREWLAQWEEGVREYQQIARQNDRELETEIVGIVQRARGFQTIGTNHFDGYESEASYDSEQDMHANVERAAKRARLEQNRPAPIGYGVGDTSFAIVGVTGRNGARFPGWDGTMKNLNENADEAFCKNWRETEEQRRKIVEKGKSHQFLQLVAGRVARR